MCRYRLPLGKSMPFFTVMLVLFWCIKSPSISRPPINLMRIFSFASNLLFIVVAKIVVSACFNEFQTILKRIKVTNGQIMIKKWYWFTRKKISSVTCCWPTILCVRKVFKSLFVSLYSKKSNGIRRTNDDLFFCFSFQIDPRECSTQVQESEVMSMVLWFFENIYLQFEVCYFEYFRNFCVWIFSVIVLITKSSIFFFKIDNCVLKIFYSKDQ